MPKPPIHHAMGRQWEILVRLPRRPPGITAKELTEQLNDRGYPVNKRTVERDLNELSEPFKLTRNHDSKPYGWYYSPTSPLDIGGLAVEDALSLITAEAVLRRTLPSSMLGVFESKFKQARQKLDSLNGHPISRWAKKVRHIAASLPLQAPKVHPSTLDAVQQALINEQQLIIEYSNISASTKRSLTIDPLALVLKGNILYLIAVAHDFVDPRLYALHRIHNAKPAKSPTRPHPDFSVDDFIRDGRMEFGGGEWIDFSATVSNTLAIHLQETPMSPDQELTFRKKQWHVSARVPNSWELKFWILAHAEEITVLKPKSLRQKIEAKIKQAAANYKG